MERTELLAKFSKYLQDCGILVVDRGEHSRSNLVQNLVRLGAPEPRISTAETFDAAVSIIDRIRPKLVLTDSYLGYESGLDLIKEHAKAVQAPDTLFVVVTAVSEQATVAGAAEAGVDTYILKPFHSENFDEILLTTAENKLFPSEYLRILEEGKAFLTQGLIDRAIGKFEQAMTLDQKPVLACFYLGQAKEVQEKLDAARAAYQKGLGFDKIHFRCLAALMDLLYRQQRHREAYDVAKMLAQHFAAEPKRLMATLRLAVLTENYADIEGYHDSSSRLKSTESDLAKHMGAALIVAAKYFLREEDGKKGALLAARAAEAAASRASFLRILVETLLAHDMRQQATECLGRFSQAARAESDYQVSDYLVNEGALKPQDALARGKALLDQGVRNASVYKAMIRRALEAQLRKDAESWAADATGLWPDLKREFISMVAAG